MAQIDTSMYQYRPRQRGGLLDAVSKGYSLKAQQQGLEANQMNIDASKRQQAEQEAIKAAFSQGGSYDEIRQRLVQTGAADFVLKLDEHVQKTGIAQNKEARDQFAFEVKARIDQSSEGRAVAGEERAQRKFTGDQAQGVITRDRERQKFEAEKAVGFATGGEADFQRFYKPWLESKGLQPNGKVEMEARAEFRNQQGMTPALTETTRHNKVMEGRPVGGNGDNEPLVAINGPDGKPVLVRRRDAEGKTPAATGGARPSNGVQKTSLRYYQRMRNAVENLSPIEGDIAKLGLAGQVALDKAPNWLQSQLGQTYNTASAQFTEARLRKDSGAAIPPFEYASDRKMYFAEPGDTPQTLEQKRKARKVLVDGLKFESGPAYNEYYGEDNEAGAAPGGNGSGGGQFRVTDPNGKVHQFESQEQADAFKELAGID